MKSKFNKEELEILEDIEQGKFRRIKGFNKINKEIKEAADNYIQKKKNINIRIGEYDLYELKRKSAETNIPYQTILASLIHRYAKGEIKLEI